MKNNTMLLIGGAGVLAYLLMLKTPKENIDSGGSTIIMPKEGGFDFAGIFDGIGNLFKGMPAQVTEINIPDIIPDIPETGMSVQDIMDIVTNTISTVGGLGGAAADGLNVDDVTDTIKNALGITDTTNKTDDSALFSKAGTGIRDMVLNLIPSGVRDLIVKPKGNWFDDWNEIQDDSDALFSEAGISEVNTPADLDLLVTASEKISGDNTPAISNPSYMSTMLGYGTRGIPSYANLDKDKLIPLLRRM